VFGSGNIPLEQVEAPLPDLSPGTQRAVRLAFTEKQPTRVQVDVLRPTGFPIATASLNGPAAIR